MTEGAGLSSPRLRWLAIRMEARYALGDAYSRGARGDALVATAHELARGAAERLGPADANSLLAEPWLPRATVVTQLADRCYDELYELAATSGWLQAA